jgi:long-chain acyl-CoA synthetase
MELLARYLEHTDRTVLALVRASDREQASSRITQLLELLFGDAGLHAHRVLAIPGDIERDGLGLAPADRDLIRARAVEIVHCAATVSFAAGLEESRRINVDGTRNVLELAERSVARGALRHFLHVSTAYVAGTYPGVFGEDDLDVGQRFRNGYEQSKHEAEHLVRDRAGRLPAVTIVRPSIIVGESTTGWTPSFNVIYVPLRAFAQRQLRALPADPSAPVDVVPVDHVADAIMQLTLAGEQGIGTYHLVAGERATTVAELVELSARHLRQPPPLIVPPRAYQAAHPLLMACARGRRRAALRRARPFLPYYTMRVRYRRDYAARRLDPHGLQPPELRSYYPRLIDHAVASRWGKQRLARGSDGTSVGVRT